MRGESKKQHVKRGQDFSPSFNVTIWADFMVYRPKCGVEKLVKTTGNRLNRVRRQSGPVFPVKIRFKAYHVFPLLVLFKMAKVPRVGQEMLCLHSEGYPCPSGRLASSESKSRLLYNSIRCFYF